MPLTLPAAPGDAPVAVGFSGGRDSTVLLHRLAADPVIRARGLRALHVDHGLQPASAGWAERCREFCAGLGVEFVPVRVDVVARGDGPEAAARRARREAFAALQRPGETIALAHHRDDQAETVLLRLLRGAGGDGLAAMRAVRPFGSGVLWRPLLDVPSAALADYAAAHRLAWIDDPSNADDRFDRNFLRVHVLPLLAARWPAPAAALARSADRLAAQADLLAGEDARRLAQVQGFDPATLHLPALRREPRDWRDRLLRAWVAALDLPPLPGDALATIDRDVLGARADATALFAWQGAELRRWRDMLWAGRPLPPLPDGWSATWDGRAPLSLPTGETLRLEPATAFAAPLQVRARRGGERLRLPGRAHRSELRDVLQDLGVPPWRRPRLPLLFAADGELLAAGDLVVAAPLRAWLDAAGARLRVD
jgi:tRNA(Ile)-lysidine synthase